MHTHADCRSSIFSAHSISRETSYDSNYLIATNAMANLWSIFNKFAWKPTGQKFPFTLRSFAFGFHTIPSTILYYVAPRYNCKFAVENFIEIFREKYLKRW